MASVLSNYFGNLCLSQMNLTPLYMGLHEAAPNLSGAPANEISGGAYVRQSAFFSPANNKTRVLSKAITFPGMPACTVTDLAVWDNVGAGNLLFVIHLGAPIAVQANGHFLLAAGDVAISL